MDLSISLGKINLKTPYLLASGTCGFGLEFENFFNIKETATIITKGISLEPNPGNPPPRIYEAYGGLLNSIGLQNPGVDFFLKEIAYKLERKNYPYIVNVYGKEIEEYIKIIEKLNSTQALAFEINVSCPNVKKGGLAFGQDIDTLKVLLKEIKKISHKELIIKLTPNVSDIKPFVKACLEEGINIVTIANTYLGMAVDLKNFKPIFKKVYAGYSGPAIKPLTLRLVYEAQKVSEDVYIIASGGITTFKDALEYFLVGAKAVQLGSILFRDVKAPKKFKDDLKSYIASLHLNSFQELLDYFKEKRQMW